MTQTVRPRKLFKVAVGRWRSVGRPGRVAALEGVLAGKFDGPPGYCRVWVAVGDRDAIPIVWPPGFRVRRDPFELINVFHRVVAREGDVLRLGGGTAPVSPRLAGLTKSTQAFYVKTASRLPRG